MVKSSIIIGVGALLLITSAQHPVHAQVAHTKYNTTLTPIYPKPHFAKINTFGSTIGQMTPSGVNSLQPVFKWQGQASDQRVDFIIWDAVPVGGLGRQYIKGEAVYYKEGVIGGEHKPEKELLLNTIYYWSIRPTGTTAWATVDHSQRIVFVESTSTTGGFFLFKTPKH